MECSSGNMMMEEREELMVPFPPTGGEPTMRTAHFLKPALASTETHPSGFPSLTKISSNPKSGKRESDVIYHGWRAPQKGWEDWVNRLKPLYGDTWKKAGIFDAILASTIYISGRRVTHRKFMMELVEKWCPETNTFLFSWGEATITLEDILVLGGFPVLGQFVITPVETDEMLVLEQNLRKACQIIKQKTGQSSRTSTWLKWFKGGGDEKLEHEAFLVLWLSRYVFPGSYDKIAKDLFLIAINLSRGIPIALGTAVLATIYRDLGALKGFLLARDNTKIGLCSPLGLVLIWAWERFPLLSPEPNPIELEQPRLARWHHKHLVEDTDDIGQALDSAGEYFEWRPYTRKFANWNPNKLYQETEQYIIVGPNMDSEVETWVRWCRTSVLVAFDCMSQYFPHRVGMQFGFDQDVPGFAVNWDAWNYYNRSITDEKLYVPARLYESDVTQSYLEHWRAHQLKLRSEDGAQNDTLHHDVMEQESESFPLQKDDDKVAEKQSVAEIPQDNPNCDDLTIKQESGAESLSFSLKNDVPKPVARKLFPLQNEGGVIAKHSGASILSSSSVTNGDPYLFNSDDENVKGVPWKKRLVRLWEEEGKSNTDSGDQQFSGDSEDDQTLQESLTMLRNELKNSRVGLGNLEERVRRVKKQHS